MLQELRDSSVASGTGGDRNDEGAQAFCILPFTALCFCPSLRLQFSFLRVHTSLNIHLEVKKLRLSFFIKKGTYSRMVRRSFKMDHEKIREMFVSVLHVHTCVYYVCIS